jgi:uncharacterized protein
MSDSIQYVSIGVDDMARTVDFCTGGLGLDLEAQTDTTSQFGLVTFIRLSEDAKLAIWPRHVLELETHERQGLDTITIPVRRATHEAVVELLSRAQQAGAEILAPLSTLPLAGFVAHFRDPDGHIWEVVCDAAYAAN